MVLAEKSGVITLLHDCKVFTRYPLQLCPQWNQIYFFMLSSRINSWNKNSCSPCFIRYRSEFQDSLPRRSAARRLLSRKPRRVCGDPDQRWTPLLFVWPTGMSFSDTIEECEHEELCNFTHKHAHTHTRVTYLTQGRTQMSYNLSSVHLIISTTWLTGSPSPVFLFFSYGVLLSLSFSPLFSLPSFPMHLPFSLSITPI